MGLITINLGDAFLKYTSPQCQHLCIAIAQISQRNYLFVTVTTKKKVPRLHVFFHLAQMYQILSFMSLLLLIDLPLK